MIQLQTKPSEHIFSNGYDAELVQRLMHDAALAKQCVEAMQAAHSVICNHKRGALTEAHNLIFDVLFPGRAR